MRDWWDRRRRERDRALHPFGAPEDEGGAGVREPRRPRKPNLSGGVALEEPHTDQHD